MGASRSTGCSTRGAGSGPGWGGKPHPLPALLCSAGGASARVTDPQARASQPGATKSFQGATRCGGCGQRCRDEPGDPREQPAGRGAAALSSGSRLRKNRPVVFPRPGRRRELRPVRGGWRVCVGARGSDRSSLAGTGSPGSAGQHVGPRRREAAAPARGREPWRGCLPLQPGNPVPPPGASELPQGSGSRLPNQCLQQRPAAAAGLRRPRPRPARPGPALTRAAPAERSAAGPGRRRRRRAGRGARTRRRRGRAVNQRAAK